MTKLLPFNIQQYREILNRQPTRREDAVRVVMGCSSYQEFARYYRQTPQLFLGLFKKNCSYLKRKSYSEIYRSGKFGIMSPLDYVGMLSFVLPLFKNEINDFVELRYQYETFYLEGKYIEAEDILNRMNGTISYSVWAAANLIKLSELTGGLDKRLDTFNKLNALGIQPLTSYMCDQAQETASISASALLFNEKRKAEIDGFNFDMKWQTDYLLMHLFPYEEIDLNECLSYDFKSSLIDLYADFIIFLPQLLVSYKDNSNFLEYLGTIVKAINDDRLRKYGVLAGVINDGINSGRRNACDVDSIFEECVEAVKQGEEIGIPDGSLKERIKYHLRYYLENKDKMLHGNKLGMIGLSNPGLHPLRRLCELMKDLEGSNFANFGCNSWMYSEGWRVLDGIYYSSPLQRSTFLSEHSWKELFPGHLPATLSLENVMQILVSWDKTVFATELEQRLMADAVPEFSKGLILGFLFENYLKKKEYKNAILLYVRYRLEHPNVIPVIDKELVEYEMVRSVDISLDCHMELAVFYRMINGKAAKISANATRYIMESELDTPGDIECDGSALSVYFMDKVLDINTLDLSPVFYESSEEVMRDRIRICQKLKIATNDRKYGHEINHLITELGIQGFLEQVGNSKIDVDELLLKRHELDDAREFFNVYLGIDPKLQIMADDSILKGLFPKEMNAIKGNDQKSNEKNIVPIPYKQLLFTSFILILREAFLLNDNAGLDYYLSSRVRHGTIKNQLRHHLQQEGLTTRKNAAGQYDMNVEWVEHRLGFVGESTTRALDSFLHFSQRVDEILQVLKDHKIQVKTESYNKDLDACFDLSLEHLQEGVYKLYQQDNKVFSTVVDDAFKLFWNRVEDCFADVKKSIKDTENLLCEELDKLYDDIVVLSNGDMSTLSKFKDTITTCKTHLQHDCKIVSDWFQRSQISNKPFTMEELANASLRGINQYCNIKIQDTREINAPTLFAGRNIGHFYAMFHDILNNVVDYYEGKGRTIAPCVIQISESHGFLQIKVSNTIEKEDENEILDKINEFKVSRAKVLMGHQTRMEGNTGFYKINNVVNYFLLDNGNSYEMELSNGIFETQITINMHNIRYEEDSAN